MRILHVISQRPEQTGSGIYVQSIIREAGKRGHENFLLAGIPKNDYPSLDMISQQNSSFVEFERENLPFPIVGMSDIMPYHSKRFSDLTDDQLAIYQTAFREKLFEAVSRFQPDIIHSHHLWILTALVRKTFPTIPLVTSCHGTDLRQMANCPQRGDQVARYCQEINHVLVLSQSHIQQVNHTYNVPKKRIHIIGGGYNSDLFHNSQKPINSRVEILYVGKLSRSKGVPWLLKSLNQIKGLPWFLHLVGSGSGAEHEECLKWANYLKGKIKLYGMLSQTEVAQLMRQSHLFVLPSFYEGLPLVLLEALASGCRIISTSLPGTQELFRDSLEEIVKLIPLPPLETIDRPHAKDEPVLENLLSETLKNQINRILEKPDIDLTPARGIINYFSWAAVFKRIEQIYQNAVEISKCG